MLEDRKVRKASVTVVNVHRGKYVTELHFGGTTIKFPYQKGDLLIKAPFWQPCGDLEITTNKQWQPEKEMRYFRQLDRHSLPKCRFEIFEARDYLPFDSSLDEAADLIWHSVNDLIDSYIKGKNL